MVRKFWCAVVLRGLCSAAILATCVSFAQAQSVYSIEEDWELTVTQPDADSAGPQVVCAISPLGHTNANHATFEVNHRSLPSFSSGGLQLQIWNGEEAQTSRKFPNDSLMQTPNETVRWTVRMTIFGDYILYEIRDGHSHTWTEFGGQGYLRAAVPTTLTNLNGYSPTVSVANSGVSYASHRVSNLALKEVRAYFSNGQTVVDNTVRVVHSTQ